MQVSEINKYKSGPWDGWFKLIKLVEPSLFILKCLYQAKKVSGHVFVC
jgi:hypothetical protein